MGSPNLCDRSWVTDQYDRFVRGNSVLAQPDDAGMVRIDEHTNLGIALATDANGRYCQLNPYLGAQLALSEAYRNVAVSGAQPVAVTDCLNFGSPEDPEVMWQFVEAIKGLVDGCLALGTPVTGGNVSFYNQTGGRNILPTPQIPACSVSSTTCAPGSRWASPGRAMSSCCSARPRRNWAVRLGPRSSTPTSAGCRRTRTSMASGRWHR